MATTTQVGFSRLGGAALSGDLGQALSDQLGRLVHRVLGRAAQPSNDSLTGPSLRELTPNLSNEISRI